MPFLNLNDNFITLFTTDYQYIMVSKKRSKNFNKLCLPHFDILIFKKCQAFFFFKTRCCKIIDHTILILAWHLLHYWHRYDAFSVRWGQGSFRNKYYPSISAGWSVNVHVQHRLKIRKTTVMYLAIQACGDFLNAY